MNALTEDVMKGSLKSKVVRTLLLMGLVALVCGFMAAQDIKTNYMPGTDFSKYKTYKWVSIQGAEQPDQIVQQQIKQAVDGQLAAKGMTKTDDDKADMYVGFQVSITQQRQWNAYGGGGLRWGGGMGTATSSTIQIGTLGLDFYDPATKTLIWRGQATKTLNPSKDPQKNQERLNKAVAKLLKDFPPSGK
ncbi:MAG: DUF4136 domain-containing protein [Terriglobales bacterium]